MDIKQKLNEQIFRVEKEKIDEVPDEKILEVISALKHIDQDLKPILEIFSRFIEHSTDQKFKSLMFIKLLKFYGINNSDILTCRQKIKLVDRELVKVPFLKTKHKECINILLKDLNIF
jgi:hypothetical protein